MKKARFQFRTCLPELPRVRRFCMLKLFITRENDFRSAWTAGHSHFWQSGRSFCCVIQLCQKLGFVSGQSECPAGYAKLSQKIRPVPEGYRTRAHVCRSRSQRSCSPQSHKAGSFPLYAALILVHTTAAPGFWVQGAFKYSTENGGADRRPVEILAGLGEQNIFQFFGKGRDLDILVGKQTAVYIGECRQSRVIIR